MKKIIILFLCLINLVWCWANKISWNEFLDDEGSQELVKQASEDPPEIDLIWFQIPEMWIEFQVSEFDSNDIVLEESEHKVSLGSDHIESWYTFHRKSESDFLKQNWGNDFIGKCNYWMIWSSRLDNLVDDTVWVIFKWDNFAVWFSWPHDSCFKTLEDGVKYKNTYLEWDETLFYERMKKSIRKIQ